MTEQPKDATHQATTGLHLYYKKVLDTWYVWDIMDTGSWNKSENDVDWFDSGNLIELNPPSISHADMVTALVKSGSAILSDLTPEAVNLWHLATGVAGEAGELLDAVKKHAIYTKPLDRENVLEELGDLEFYLEGIRQAIGVTREEVLQGNIDKLAKRYPGFNYTNQAAQNRADKA
jgi:NTP pyrophosphatase (non-canonical NTP hydrolase)